MKGTATKRHRERPCNGVGRLKVDLVKRSTFGIRNRAQEREEGSCSCFFRLKSGKVWGEQKLCAQRKWRKC